MHTAADPIHFISCISSDSRAKGGDLIVRRSVHTVDLNLKKLRVWGALDPWSSGTACCSPDISYRSLCTKKHFLAVGYPYTILLGAEYKSKISAFSFISHYADLVSGIHTLQADILLQALDMSRELGRLRTSWLRRLTCVSLQNRSDRV